MARLPSGKRQYQISELWDSHREINRRLVMGQSQKDIAKAMGISEAKVSYTKNSAVSSDNLNSLRDARDQKAIDVATQIKELAPEALDVLTDLMCDTDSPRALKAKVAIDLLDRAGYSPPKKVAHAVMHKHFTETDLNDIKERAKEIGITTGVIVQQ
jgi:transcriptional regulator with XRE-family HTH domain